MVNGVYRRVARAGVVAALLLVGGAPTHGRAAASTSASPARWLSANARARTVTLTLIAGYTNALEGFNFDGYGEGAMVVSIPRGYRVTVVYRNNGAYPHSIMVTPYAKKDLASGWPLAFRGAASADLANGAAHGSTQRFPFVVDRVGTYAIICAVSGHEQLGMWDVLRVTRGGAPSITIGHGRS